MFSRTKRNRVLLEASPVKTLKQAVDSNSKKIVPPTDKERYAQAISAYSTLKDKAALDPYNADNGFKDESGRVVVDRWADAVLGALSEVEFRQQVKQASATRKADNPITKYGAVKIEENEKYVVYAINCQQAARDMMFAGVVKDGLAEDIFTEAPQGVSAGATEGLYATYDGSPEEYAEWLATRPFAMIPTWCVAGSSRGQTFWDIYTLSEAAYPKCFIINSKKHANWRFIITFDEEGNIFDFRDPWQIGGADSKRKVGEQIFAACFNESPRSVESVVLAAKKDEQLMNCKEAVLQYVDLVESYQSRMAYDLASLEKALSFGIDINEGLVEPDFYTMPNGEQGYVKYPIQKAVVCAIQNKKNEGKMSRSYRIVETMLKAGANANQSFTFAGGDDEIISLLALVEQNGLTEIAALLRKYGAKETTVKTTKQPRAAVTVDLDKNAISNAADLINALHEVVGVIKSGGGSLTTYQPFTLISDLAIDHLQDASSAKIAAASGDLLTYLEFAFQDESKIATERDSEEGRRAMLNPIVRLLHSGSPKFRPLAEEMCRVAFKNGYSPNDDIRFGRITASIAMYCVVHRKVEYLRDNLEFLFNTCGAAWQTPTDGVESYINDKLFGANAEERIHLLLELGIVDEQHLLNLSPKAAEFLD